MLTLERSASDDSAVRTTAHRADVQGLRAVAVLLVVVYHAGLPLPGGFIGVDVFFVISGFVIASMLLRHLEGTAGIGFVSFYTRRARRLLPALAVLLVFVAIGSTLFLSPFGPQQATARTGIAAATFRANLQLGGSASGDYFGLVAESNALLHTWSLSIEEQFYFVFPALLLLAWRLSLRRPRRTAGAVVLAVTVGSFAFSCLASMSSTPTVDAFAFYSPLTRTWEFGVGVILAFAAPFLVGRLGGGSRLLGPAGVVLLGAGAVWITGSTSFPGVAALLPVLGTALIITGGFTPGGVAKVLGTPPLVWIGDLSYSWYLWHWPLIVFATVMWPRSSAVPVVAAGLALGPAWLSHRYVENPIRFDERLSGRRILPLVAVCIAVPVLAFVALPAIGRAERGTAAAKGLQPAIRLHRGEDTATIEDATGSIVVVGDSNAGQFVEPMEEVARERGYGLIVRDNAGCPFADIIRGSKPEEGFEGELCHQSVLETVRLLQHSPASLVIVAMSSPMYLAEGPLELDLRDPRTGEVASTPERKAVVLGDGLARTLRALIDADVPVVLIHTIPQFGVAAGDWHSRTCPGLRVLTSSCGITVDRTEIEARQAPARDAEERAIARVPGVASADFTDDLCPTDECATDRDGTWLYRDAIHLSVDGALSLTGRLGDLVDANATPPDRAVANRP